MDTEYSYGLWIQSDPWKPDAYALPMGLTCFRWWEGELYFDIDRYDNDTWHWVLKRKGRPGYGHEYLTGCDPRDNPATLHQALADAKAAAEKLFSHGRGKCDCGGPIAAVEEEGEDPAWVCPKCRRWYGDGVRNSEGAAAEEVAP